MKKQILLIIGILLLFIIGCSNENGIEDVGEGIEEAGEEIEEVGEEVKISPIDKNSQIRNTDLQK